MAESTSNSLLTNDTELERISDVVSNATFFTMASCCKSKGQKNTILTLEYLFYTRYKGVIRRFFGGSTAEGTNLKDSDVDKMIVFSNITACTERDQSKNINGHVFILDTSVCHPGFARLIPVKLDPNIKTIFNDHGKTIYDMLETIEGDKTFLSSDKMVDFWLHFLTKTKTADTPTETSRHGPSATAANTDIYGYIKEKLGASVEQDFAFGISLYEWPIDGDEWIARERKHGWPSPEFIEKITKLKCHVVAVGDKMSPTSSLEWRVSFLLQERELVWNFNDTQLQCFILMKNILKKCLHPIAPDEVSSYHMKTILLWQSENNPQYLWQPKYLLRCTMNCLLFLKHCIENLHLEHYIDRRKNLFAYKFENYILKENMIKCIEVISDDIVVHVLQCVEGVDLLSPWLESEMGVDNFLQLCRERLDFKITTEFETFRLPLKYFHKGQSFLGVNIETVLADFKLLSEYFVGFEDHKPSTDIEDSFIEAVRMFINIRIALTLLETIIDVKDNTVKQQKLEKLQKFLDDNQNIDAISGKLYVATYYLRLQNSQKVISIIRSILDSPSQNLLYTGHCSKYKSIHIGNGTATQLKGLPNPFDHKKKYLSTAQDVIFSRADLSFVPHALKLECIVGRAFMIHPLVYMLYLAVISTECEQEAYMYALESTVNKCEGSFHGYRHLNILGCCYFHIGDYKKAFECYTKSLTQTVPTGRQNAALLHLIILMFRLINNGYGDECIYRRK
ncbi:uncharacterized protein LOC127715075 [Mytilus californianus]|uniref:uncharacterized protein LOC127715075 n=1 Tax=Mytilus californianus TaxID=6549 RepID=UPI00224784F4|nr:uncharacterized protein LOC127715075 [Mytilus californianus]